MIKFNKPCPSPHVLWNSIKHLALLKGVCLLIMTLRKCPSIQSLASVWYLNRLRSWYCKGCVRIILCRSIFLVISRRRTSLDCCKIFCIFYDISSKRNWILISLHPYAKFLLKFCILKWPLQVEWGFVPIPCGSRFALNRCATAHHGAVMYSDILHTSAVHFRWCGWLSELLLLCWKEASSAEKYPPAKSELEAAMKDIKRLLPTDNCNWWEKTLFSLKTRMDEKILPVKLLTSWVYTESESIGTWDSSLKA